MYVYVCVCITKGSMVLIYEKDTKLNLVCEFGNYVWQTEHNKGNEVDITWFRYDLNVDKFSWKFCTYEMFVSEKSV